MATSFYRHPSGHMYPSCSSTSTSNGIVFVLLWLFYIFINKKTEKSDFFQKNSRIFQDEGWVLDKNSGRFCSVAPSPHFPPLQPSTNATKRQSDPRNFLPWKHRKQETVIAPQLLRLWILWSSFLASNIRVWVPLIGSGRALEWPKWWRCVKIEIRTSFSTKCW